MPITLTLPEYITLLNGADDSLFAARAWIIRNTEAAGWGRVISQAHALQVARQDPEELLCHIETYEDDAGDKIYVCFARQDWFECNERTRLTKLRAALTRGDYNKKNECLELASYASKQLLAASFGGLDWKKIFFERVEAFDYSTPRFAAWLQQFNAFVKETRPTLNLFPADFTH